MTITAFVWSVAASLVAGILIETVRAIYHKCKNDRLGRGDH